MMRQKGLNDLRTRKDIPTLKGVVCPVCTGTGIDPDTGLRCPECHGTRHVRPYRLSL